MSEWRCPMCGLLQDKEGAMGMTLAFSDDGKTLTHVLECEDCGQSFENAFVEEFWAKPEKERMEVREDMKRQLVERFDIAWEENMR